MDRRAEGRSALRRGDAHRAGDEGVHGEAARLRRQVLMDLRKLIRDVPDFPKPGIVFKDITPLLRSSEAFDAAVNGLAQPFRAEGITSVAGTAPRGFVCGAAAARRRGAGFGPIRKPGKLPWTTRRNEYQ